MNDVELKVVESFRRCKNDIIKMQNKIADIAQAQERIMEHVDDLRKKIQVKPKTIVKTVKSKPKVIVKTVKSKPKVVVKRIKSKPKVIVKTVKSKPKVVVKTVHARAKKVFVATKEGNVVHDMHCPFAKNILPKHKVIFRSKATALNKGYKLCACLKK